MVVGKQRITLKKDAVPKFFETNGTILNNTMAPMVSTNTNDASHANSSAQCTNLCIQSDQTQAADADQSAQNRNRDGCNRCNELTKLNDILKAEYNNLRQEFIELNSKRDIEEANFKKEMIKFKADADIRKQHIKYLSSKVYRKEKSEELLKLLLEDLKAQNVLSTKAYETLEVG